MAAEKVPDYHLYTDGGSSAGSLAAGACIIVDAKTNEHSCFGIALGTATNNEAEIFAALLGFAALKKMSDEASISIHWVADSEYLLKSATGYINNWQRNGWKTADKKPVKNQGLWRTYLTLTKGFKISHEHVRGHTGHLENESCDSAVGFIKEETESLFAQQRSVVTEISTPIGDYDWCCVDGRKLMALLRTEEPDVEEQLLLLELLEQPSVGAQSPVREVKKRNPLLPVIQSLEQSCQLLEKAVRAKATDEARLLELRGLIEKLRA